MSTNYTLGQYVKRVRWNKTEVGKIVELDKCDMNIKMVSSDEIIWACTLPHDWEILSDEELTLIQEQVKRQAYADQYL